MTTDRFILQSFEKIDENLELSLQRLSLSLSPKPHNKDDDEQLQDLQEKLQKIKVIVGNVHKCLQSHFAKTVTVDYAALLEILSDLAGTPSSEEQNPLQTLVTRTIYQYVILLCYYTLKNEAIACLPQVYDAGRYYKSISDSKFRSALYSIQTLPKKLLRLYDKLIDNINKAKVLDSSSDVSMQTVRNVSKNLLEDFKPQWNKMMMVHNLRFVGLPKKSVNWAYFLLNLPRAMIRDELHKKLDYIDQLTKSYTIKLGQLILSFESNDKEDLLKDYGKSISTLQEFFNLPANDNLHSVVESTMTFRYNIEKMSIRKPGVATRYWPTALFTLVYGPSSAIYVWQSRFRILHFLQENVVDFAMGLVYNWVYIPLKNVWATVRHDDDSSIAMISEGTLESEINSLTRMIVGFVNEQSGSKIDEDLLIQQIGHGDLTEFMEIYENQLEHPIKNIATGGLIRSLLIQIQKTKVDGSLALNGIDKMLQSQQLVFGVVALSPALLILYVTTACFYRLIKVGSFWSNVKDYKRKLSACLNNVERLLNYDDSGNNHSTEAYMTQGLLTIEIASVAQYGNALIPSSRLEEWYRDVEEISDSNFSNRARLNVVNRIYHVYGKFF